MSVVFEIPVKQIDDELSPDTLKSWDSLKHMNLVAALEEEFNVEFSDGEIPLLSIYSSIITILSEKINR